MNIKKKFFLIILIIFILSIITIYILHQKSHRKKKEIKQISKIESDLKIKNFKLQQAMQNKSNKWILKAKKGKIFREENKAECEETQATLLHKNKKIASFYAPKCNFNLKNNQIKMDGKIKSEILNNSTSNNSSN